ncbi:hypothetical protein B0A50_04034 [Salinomyces thailandicus]|uniref:Glycosyl hydrolase n=1 Tax=Salinomyces thailandicus TaxID=706561 RepID=A0A4U0TZP1_9PEZI|nr:hypothetical protein B0A50_04034 [Salinomyces thailandica]
MPPLRLRIDGATFRDPHNREITLHGINVAGDTKYPAHPDIPSHVKDGFFSTADSATFVDRPFSVAEAHTHFARLKRWGYNTIRYIFTWEAVEHAGPGQYDEEFCQHTIQLLRVAKTYGFYIFMDPHQDVWSRFTGGSGAPMWTIYACGFDPEKFHVTQAALVQNTWPDPVNFPKMVWATNYQRLACQTIFTFFFAGKEFAPKCVIDGKNIQDWLQDHFVAACGHLARRIHEAGDLHGDVVIGYESVNEPNNGFIGHPDLSRIPKNQNLRKDTCPTAFQAILTGAGRAIEMETYAFGSFGPYKSGTQLVDPHGNQAWLDPTVWDDSKYGWKRADSWKLGECIWAQHGMWDPKTDELLMPQYFLQHPHTGKKMDIDYFLNNNFLTYYRKYKNAIRSVWPEAIMLMQPQPFEVPPRIKGTKDDDNNMIFASHFYDGITLIMKKWNKLWNVDVLGILRGKYASPAFALKIGETAIRNCFKDQLTTVRQEGLENMGVHPCIYTEIGIPYDMDDAYAYRTGDYSSQAAAIDANMFAVEGSGAAGFTWWLYTASNSHFWGDNWNGEDLSIFCTEDRPLPPPASIEPGQTEGASLDPSSASYSSSRSESNRPVTPGSLQKTLTNSDRMSHASSSSPKDSQTQFSRSRSGDAAGFRAAEAYVRPHPELTHGTITSHGFDLKTCRFHVRLTAPSPTTTDHPTEVFLPAFHFPKDKTNVVVSGGKWEISVRVVGGEAEQQVFRWWHGAGEQGCEITGVKRKGGTLAILGEEEEGWLGGYWGKGCEVM